MIKITNRKIYAALAATFLLGIYLSVYQSYCCTLDAPRLILYFLPALVVLVFWLISNAGPWRVSMNTDEDFSGPGYALTEAEVESGATFRDRARGTRCKIKSGFRT